MGKKYGPLQLDWREVNTGKDDIILIDDDIRGYWEIYFFHSMVCYVLTNKHFGNLCEGSNEGVEWMLSQFQEIKDTSVELTINKTIQGCV